MESGGSINGMIDAVQQVVSQLPPDDKVIPGQGPVSNFDDGRAYLGMLMETRDAVQKALKEGFNLYAAGEGGAPQADTKSQVRQGFIEKSNVNAVAEMSRMIEVTRAYTQISTLLQQQSDLHKTAIAALADVPA